MVTDQGRPRPKVIELEGELNKYASYHYRKIDACWGEMKLAISRLG